LTKKSVNFVVFYNIFSDAEINIICLIISVCAQVQKCTGAHTEICKKDFCKFFPNYYFFNSAIFSYFFFHNEIILGTVLGVYLKIIFLLRAIKGYENNYCLTVDNYVSAFVKIL